MLTNSKWRKRQPCKNRTLDFEIRGFGNWGRDLNIRNRSKQSSNPDPYWVYFCFIWKLLFREIRQKFWASKAAFGGIQLSIFSKINRYSANGGLFLSKAYLIREYEPNWFFGCCHHILKMFDFWPHLLLTACQKFWLVLFIYKLFLDRGRTSEREPDFHISRRFLPLFSM